MKAISAVLVALAFVYAFYTASLAAWSYFEMSDVVEKALEDNARAGVAPLREAIVKGATDAGVAVQEQQIVVAEDDSNVRVRVRWTWPVINYGGAEVIALPLWLERSVTRL
jgi:hypothetical protein